MTLDQVLLVCVPVVTGVLALLGSWFGSRLGRINEYRQWLRNQKQAAYSELLGVFDALYLKTGRREVNDADVQTVLFDLVVKQGRLSVVGVEGVRVISARLVDEAWAMVQAARGVGPDSEKRYELREAAKVTADELIGRIRVDLSVEKLSSAKPQ